MTSEELTARAAARLAFIHSPNGTSRERNNPLPGNAIGELAHILAGANNPRYHASATMTRRLLRAAVWLEVENRELRETVALLEYALDKARARE
jgi:hypothetical protein